MASVASHVIRRHASPLVIVTIDSIGHPLSM